MFFILSVIKKFAFVDHKTAQQSESAIEIIKLWTKVILSILPTSINSSEANLPDYFVKV